ncbi:MAG: helix-turn-helix transcriptional regulator [Acidimicrobiia bacterium]|nr:helix-turn-helix transcriptional regulator [Acidimicrobiia bacterium]
MRSSAFTALPACQACLTVTGNPLQSRDSYHECQYELVPKKRLRVLEGCCSVLVEPIDESSAAELAQGFHALADPARLRLLSLIAAQPAGEVCACDLVEPLGKAQPTVSHHLKVLYEAGLVDRDKRGSWIWYRVVPGRLDALRAALAPALPVG